MAVLKPENFVNQDTHKTRATFVPTEDTNVAVLDDKRKGNQRPPDGHWWMPPGDYSDGDRAMAFLKKIGFHLDPWQEWVLRESLTREGGKHGLWTACEICLLVPRQNGKTAIMEARALVGIFVLGEKLILHTAQLFNTSRESYYRVRAIIEKIPELRAITNFRSGNDNMSFEIIAPKEPGMPAHPNQGARIVYMARGGGSGRGWSADVVMLDEAYSLDDDQVAAVSYATSARHNAQTWYGSSTGLEESETLLGIRQRGLNHDPDLALFEWCAVATVGEVDLDDIEMYYMSNPAVGIRIRIKTILKERRQQPDKQFGRERLGLWADNAFRSVISATHWKSLCRCGGSVHEEHYEVSAGQITGDYVVSIDAAPDGTRATLAISGWSGDEELQIEIDQDGRGLDWCVKAVKELYSSTLSPDPQAVVIQAGTTAGRLIPELEAEGMRVIPFGQRDITDACHFFYDKAMESKLHHLGDISLASALSGATRIFVGKMGGDPDDPDYRAWYWGRKDSTVDITGLCASTYASWGLNLMKTEAKMEKKDYDDKPRGGWVW